MRLFCEDINFFINKISSGLTCNDSIINGLESIIIIGIVLSLLSFFGLYLYVKKPIIRKFLNKILKRGK